MTRIKRNPDITLVRRKDNELQKKVEKERNSDRRVSQGTSTRERECPGALSSRVTSTAVLQCVRLSLCLSVCVGVGVFVCALE